MSLIFLFFSVRSALCCFCSYDGPVLSIVCGFMLTAPKECCSAYCTCIAKFSPAGLCSECSLGQAFYREVHPTAYLKKSSFQLEHASQKQSGYLSQSKQPIWTGPEELDRGRRQFDILLVIFSGGVLLTWIQVSRIPVHLPDQTPRVWAVADAVHDSSWSWCHCCYISCRRLLSLLPALSVVAAFSRLILPLSLWDTPNPRRPQNCK